MLAICRIRFIAEAIHDGRLLAKLLIFDLSRGCRFRLKSCHVCADRIYAD